MMTEFSPILAATDLSSPSRHASDRAFRLAAESGSALHLLHVLHLGALEQMSQLLGPDAQKYGRQIAEEARAELAKLAADSNRNRGICARIHLAEGPVLDSIADHARAVEAGLLVVGARGEGFLRHMLLGSTASRILSKVSLPVLVVKQSPHEAYRRVLVAVDFSPVSARAVVQARLLAPRAEIVLLHAFEVPFEGKLAFAGVEEEVIHRYRISARQQGMQRLRDFAGSVGLARGNAMLVVQHGEASLQILRQEQEQDCDLIVMGKRGSLLEDYLLGSVTRHVLAESQGDVLVVNGRC